MEKNFNFQKKKMSLLARRKSFSNDDEIFSHESSRKTSYFCVMPSIDAHSNDDDDDNKRREKGNLFT